MTRLARVCTTVYLTALGIWTGSLMMTAAAAAVTFSTIKKLDAVVPTLDPLTRPHWQFVGGKVVSGVFLISHLVQAVCALLAIVSLVCLCRTTDSAFRARLRRSVSLYSTGLSMLVLGWYLLLLWPRMRENLYAYWDHLAAGRIEPARIAQKAFDADHPLASTTLQVLLVLLVIALISGLWSATARPEQRA